MVRQIYKCFDISTWPPHDKVRYLPILLLFIIIIIIINFECYPSWTLYGLGDTSILGGAVKGGR